MFRFSYSYAILIVYLHMFNPMLPVGGVSDEPSVRAGRRGEAG